MASDPEVVEKFLSIATYTSHGGPAELLTYVKAEQELWKPVIQQIGMKAVPKN